MKKQSNEEPITVLDRTVSAFVHGAVSLIVFGSIHVFLVLKSVKVPSLSDAITDQPYFIYFVVVFSVVAFILGPKRMAHLWGMVFRTNRKD